MVAKSLGRYTSTVGRPRRTDFGYELRIKEAQSAGLVMQ